MVANMLQADPLPHDPREWDQKVIYSKYGRIAYQIKGLSAMQQHGSKHFACIRSPLRDGVKRLNLNFFSHHGHVAYQIKKNHYM